MPLTIEFAMEVGDDNRKNGLRTDRDTTLEGTRRSESAAPPRHTQLPVVDQAGSVEGLTSLNRLRAVPQPQRSTTTLREVAVPLTRIPTGQPDESLSALLPRFSRTTDGHILVLSGSELVGIIAPSDINRIAAEHGLPMAIPAATPSPARNRAPEELVVPRSTTPAVTTAPGATPSSWNAAAPATTADSLRNPSLERVTKPRK